MTPERWERVTSVFQLALERAPEERAACVAEACAGDEELRREVEHLLAWHERSGAFLAAPALGAAARLAAAGYEDPTLVRPAADEGANDPRLGAVLDGKYRVEALIGQGGMGVVYRATQLGLDRQVAVKVMHGDALRDSDALTRFRREAVAVARLRHPHIVAVYDFGTTAEVGAYLVMEYLEGRSLRRELAERRRVPPEEAVRLIRQALGAVAAAHEAGVVHRDLKPENLFLEAAPGAVAVKVLDFGIAKLQAPADPRLGTLTKSGAVLGTPLYMAPEQCRGEAADARSDVYALGCVLYEMLTGRPPFLADTYAALIYQHLEAEPVAPRRLAADVPDALERAVLRALAKRAEDRFGAAAFAEMLAGRDTAVVEAASGGDRPPAAEPTRGRTTGEHGAAGRATNNLPHQVTRFVGRGAELDGVRRALEGARLLTLVGPGGIGKTRLSLEAAAGALGDYTDGARLAELASVADAGALAGAIASGLGVHEEPGRSLDETLVAWLASRELLLVMDNCEHLVEACAALVARVPRECPRVRVLATSREPLRIAGETVWPVPPLEVPEASTPAERLLDCEAIDLFVDRAAKIKPGFAANAANAAALVRLARRLEGIPLAIELAAARVRALSVEQIADRLDDRFRLLGGGSREAPSRHRTLRATLDWSYELLSDDERRSLARLAVFAGGFTLEAAEAVAGRGAECSVPSAEFEGPSSTQHSAFSTQHFDVLDLLSRLVDKSLVVLNEGAGPPRYGMLETIREYALEALRASGEVEVRRRHAEVFLTFAEAAEPKLFGVDSAEWFARFEAEHDNLRAALGWLLEHDAHGALRLAVAVRNLWMTKGHFTEGRAWLERSLERAGAAAPALPRAVGLRAVGYVAKQQGDLAAARAYMEESLRVAREVGDTVQIAHSSRGLGSVAKNQGDLETARVRLEESLAMGRETANESVVANALRSLGEVARLRRDWAAARDHYERALESARRTGDRVGASMSLVNLGAVAFERGDLAEASAFYREALAIEREMGSRSEISVSLDGLAAVAAERGDVERAARLAGAAEALRESIGFELEPVDRAMRERCLRDMRERLGEAEVEARLAEGRALALERAIEDALAV